MSKDITGQRFGRLVAVEKICANSKRKGQKRQREKWLFRCDCGNEKTVLVESVMSGHTQSCGCFREDMRGYYTRKHGMSKTRLHVIWSHMKSRCYSPSCKEYKWYGARGIKMCEEWSHEDGMANFAEWAMSSGYSDSLSLDRIDVDGDYEPSNCRWITQKQQMNNTRANICA